MQLLLDGGVIDDLVGVRDPRPPQAREHLLGEAAGVATVDGDIGGVLQRLGAAREKRRELVPAQKDSRDQCEQKK